MVTQDYIGMGLEPDVRYDRFIYGYENLVGLARKTKMRTMTLTLIFSGFSAFVAAAALVYVSKIIIMQIVKVSISTCLVVGIFPYGFILSTCNH